MSHVRMLRTTLVARREDTDDVLEALQDSGIVHPVVVPVPEELEGIAQRGADTRNPDDDALAIRAQLERRRKALANVAHAPARLQVQDLPLPQVLEVVDKIIDEREHDYHQRHSVDAKIAALEPWGDFEPADLQAVRDAGVRVTFAIFTRDEWHAVDQRGLVHAIAHEDEDRVWVVMFDHDTDKLPVVDLGLPNERLSTLQAAHDQLGRDIAAHNHELGRYAHYEPTLERLMEALDDRAHLLEAYDGALTTDELFALEGWLPAENVDQLGDALTPLGVAWETHEVREDDDVPVKLKNGFFTSAFESIVQAFSGIHYREKDFTWAVGILFIVFGSLCLLDAGYGLMLAITGGILWARGSVAFGKVFAFTGILSVIVGAIAGQYFGLIVGQHIYDGYRPLLTLAEDPYSCFLFSLVVGVFGLGFSYSMAIWQRGIKTQATGSLLLVFAAAFAIFGNMASEYVLTIMTGWQQPTEFMTYNAMMVGNIGAAVAGGLALLSWLLWPEDVFGANARVGNIIWTLYSGTTGFVQDVLSHMRLFGIALSGSIMALVVNEIGGQFPLPVTIVFAIGGHFFVFLLALLSLYIHTNRLIFLEFGSKCIDGGMNLYRPLSRRSPA
jgi:V/A-type H+-transporting ATPase subunit I